MGNLTSPTDSATSPPPLLLERLSEFVETRMGLHFPPERLGDLERGIGAAAGEFGCNTVESCILWLLAAPLSHSRIETLAGHLTIGETYFFRDQKVFEILETQLLPEIIKARRGGSQSLRIWSAGCSTGEEVYSLGILLARILPDLTNWHITLLATDIAPISLKKAAAGVYSDWSFRNTPLWVKERCFERIKNSFMIASRIKRLVTFSCHNLADDPYPAIINNTNAMDIIFCRNVLMYFTRDRANAIIDNLAHCLVDGGWLVMSPVEAPGSGLPPSLYPVNFPGALLYRKGVKPRDVGRRLMVIPEAPKAIEKWPVVVATTAQSADSRRTRQPEVKVPSPPEHLVSDIEMMAKQARQLADTGQLADALALCTVALQSDKLNAAMHYLQATILQELGRADDAATSLKRALYIDQDFVVAHFSLGHLLRRQGKLKAAGKHLEKASSLLKSYGREDIPPEAEGISAERLIELINTMQGAGDRR